MIVRAPGKLILFGEYAVLDGHPALVAAIDRFAICEVAGDGPAEVAAPELTAAVARATDVTVDPVLRFAHAALAAFPSPPPGRYRLDSEDLALHVAGERHKLGLGGSAATTVALVAALHARAGARIDAARQRIFETAQSAHRAVQGTGSGADVAASTFGGLLEYRWAEATRRGAATSVTPAAPLRLLTAFTGRAASTAALVERVRALRDRAPRRYAERIDALAAAAADGIQATRAGDQAALIAAVATAAKALDALAAATGAPLVTEAHRVLAALAARRGGAAKSTGAGGGDLAWLVAPDDQLAALRDDVEAAGLMPVELAIHRGGVERCGTKTL